MSGRRLERRPDRGCGVGQSGLRRPERDPEVIGDLGHGQPEGVVEDEDRPLVRGKSPEPAVELIAIVDGQEPVGGGRCVRLEQDDIGREAPAPSGLRVTGVDEDPMEPRLEPIELAQRRELPPYLDQGDLDRVLGEVGVAQDPMRDEMQRSPTSRTRAAKASSSPVSLARRSIAAPAASWLSTPGRRQRA